MTRTQALTLKPGDTVRRKGDCTEFTVKKTKAIDGVIKVWIEPPPHYHIHEGPYWHVDLDHCTD